MGTNGWGSPPRVGTSWYDWSVYSTNAFCRRHLHGHYNAGVLFHDDTTMQSMYSTLSLREGSFRVFGLSWNIFWLEQLCLWGSLVIHSDSPKFQTSRCGDEMSAGVESLLFKTTYENIGGMLTEHYCGWCLLVEHSIAVQCLLKRHPLSGGTSLELTTL